MLKKLYGLSDKGQKALYKAAVYLTIFEIIATTPVLLLAFALSEMLGKLTGNATGTNMGVYIVAGCVILAAMYFCYRRMYRAKYLEAGMENSDLRMTIADRLRYLPEEYLSKRDLGDLTSAIMDDMMTVEGALINQVAETISGFLSAAVILAGLAFVNIKLTLYLAACLPLAFIAMALSKTISGGTHRRNREKKVKISESVQEYLENIKVLKHSDSLKKYQDKVERQIKRLLPGLVGFEFLAGGCVAAAYNVMRMGMVFVIVKGAEMLVTGEIAPPVFLLFLIMAVWVYEPLSHANEGLGALIASMVAAGRLKEIREYPVQEGTEKPVYSDYAIVFEHVDFSYDDKETLRDVSFSAKQGKITALVGASGSGKSTVCRLAARFRDISRGCIRIGGQDISQVAPEKLMELFSIVFQDVTLFNDTIYNNILIGNKNATEKEVFQAAQMAECMSFIDKMPDGIHTVIGENGHTLSGGERQRLSIARAFLKDAPIILLDENTASLDPETETQIQKAIEKLTRGKTVLMIAHRLRSVVHCDNIVVMSEGRVTGQGKHKELLEDCPAYKRIYELQADTEEQTLQN